MKKKLLAVILTMAVSCQSLPVYAGEAADIFSDSGTEMSESGESTDDFSDGEPEKDVETAEETPQTVPELISPEEEPVENIFTDNQNENDSSDENQVSAYSTDTELTYGNYKYTVSGQQATIIKYIGSESTVKIPEKINNYVVKTIGRSAFSSCSSLKKIEIPDSVTEIGDYAFQYCGSLTEVTGGRQLKKIGYEAFQYCRKLESITLSSTIKEFSSYIFDECDRLKTAGPSSGDYNIKIGFTGNIPDTPLSNSEVESVVLPEGLTELNVYALGGCTKLKEVTLPSGLKSIPNNAFISCSSLTEIEIPDSVTEIGDYAFQYCGSLTEVTGGKQLKKIGYEAFQYCQKLESITLYPTVTSISSLAFDECRLLTIYGYAGSYAETYASGQNIPFQSLGEYIPEYEDYDYTENLNRWIQDEGTASAMAYLTRDGNFMNSMLVAQWDDSFIDRVVETMSNMYFRGKDGWKQIFAGETSQNQAREVLIALLDSYSGTVLDLSQAETMKKFVKIYLDTFKQGDWAYAAAYGLSNDEIKKLASVCTEDTLSAFFVDKKYDDLADYLQNVGHFAADSKVIKCIKSFSSSKNFAKTLSNGMDLISNGLSIIKVGTDTIKRYYDIVALAKADEMYSEMLLYLKNNCEYDPICEAAKELYGVIHGTYEDQMMYLSNAAFDELSDVALESMLTSVASALPLGTVIYTSYKYSTGLANILFNTGDTQKQVDNMRCVAYIGYYLSNWMQYNKRMYQQSGISDKNYYAKRTIFAFYMLMKSRTAGETSVRKYLDIMKRSSKKEYTYSLQVTSTLEAIEKCLKSSGVLGKYSNSVISCPVNVEVYDKSGNKVLTVYDGQESSGNVGDIYYNVMYHPLDQDYVKIINLPQDSGYTLKCIATDMGKVEYYVTDIGADGTAERKETDDIPISKGSTIEITNIAEEKPSCKLLDEKGNVKEEYTAQPEKTEYIEVAEIKTDTDAVNLKVGEKVLINAQILPDNATTKNIIWSSADDTIAKINSDGVVEGMAAGETTARVASAENRDLFKEIKVTVVKEETPVIPTATPIPKPSAPKLSKLTVSNNSITFTWKKVSGASGYQIYRKTDSGKWTPIKTTKGTSYKDTKVKAGYKYTYTVKAYKTVKRKKTYSSYNKKGLSGKLTTVISLSLKSHKAVINWKKTTGAVGYYIYRSTSANGKFSKIKAVARGNTLKYTDKSVKKNKKYYYKVVPYGKIKGKKLTGTYSAVKKIVIK